MLNPYFRLQVTNGFADGLRVAERMAQETPELFDALVATPVRFENDGGGGRSALWHTSPILEAKPEYVTPSLHISLEC